MPTPASPKPEAAPAKKEKTTKEPVAQEPAKPVSKKPVPARPLYVPGAIYQATVDQNYFMSYGYEDTRLAVPVNSDLFLKPSKDGANVVSFGDTPVRLSGFVWPKNTEQVLRGTAYVVDEPTGDGHIIMFTSDIAFRRLWRSLDRLLLNAVIFAPGY